MLDPIYYPKCSLEKWSRPGEQGNTGPNSQLPTTFSISKQVPNLKFLVEIVSLTVNFYKST